MWIRRVRRCVCRFTTSPLILFLSPSTHGVQFHILRKGIPMPRKFLGFAIIAGMTAMLSLCSIPTVQRTGAQAGLFGNRGGPLGFGILSSPYAACGGGGGLQNAYATCGGGGLQSAGYASCSGGGGGLQMAFSSPYASCSGGGGGLQYAPAYYQPSYYQPSYAQPTYYYPSSGGGCPGGVCPPGGGLSSYSPTYYAPTYQTASVPIQLNPGEVYVAGSLRAVTTETPSALTATASKPKTQPESRVSRPEQLQGKPGLLPDGVELVQITQDNCHPCEQDRQLLRQSGVALTVLNMNVPEDAFKVANYWGQFSAGPDGDELGGTPAYMLIRNGRVFAKMNHSIGSKAGVDRMLAEARNYPDSKTIVAETLPAKPAPDKLDRIEEAMVKMSDNMLRMSDDMHAMRAAMEASPKTALK